MGRKVSTIKEKKLSGTLASFQLRANKSASPFFFKVRFIVTYNFFIKTNTIRLLTCTKVLNHYIKTISKNYYPNLDSKKIICGNT